MGLDVSQTSPKDNVGSCASSNKPLLNVKVQDVEIVAGTGLKAEGQAHQQRPAGVKGALDIHLAVFVLAQEFELQRGAAIQ